MLAASKPPSQIEKLQNHLLQYHLLHFRVNLKRRISDKDIYHHCTLSIDYYLSYNSIRLTLDLWPYRQRTELPGSAMHIYISFFVVFSSTK